MANISTQNAESGCEVIFVVKNYLLCKMFVVKTLSMLNRSNINMLARLTNLMAQLIDGSQIPLVLPSSPRQAGASDDALASPPPFLLFRTTLHPIRLLRQR